MEITGGSLDEISRPASCSRAYRNCRSLSTSMELLKPEPYLRKVDSPAILAGSHQRGSAEYCCPEENKGNDREESHVKEVRANQQTSVATNSSNLEDSEETDVDPQIQAAIKKMHKLDTILAKKDFAERAVKKQGKEMRAKLWEELQSISTTGSHEEIENTKLFLALISSWQDTTDPTDTKEDELYTSVFHTQINPEDDDCHKTQHSQDCPSELETNKFLNQAEKMHSKSKNNQNFIKKNIELAKDSGKQIVMLQGERKRLDELLKEEDISGLLAPGEGYTPEPIEFHHLNEIDIKLQVLVSDGDFSAIFNSCSKPPIQIYQEALVYANRSLEAVLGEKVLRDNKEQRDQQNRLKEIDHQLKSLERNLTEEQMGLSGEQLKTLLDECMQSQRTISNVTMPKSQESLSCELSPPCYTSQDSTFHSTSTLPKMLVEDHIVGMLKAQEKVGLKDKSLCVNAKSEIPGYYISKVLGDSHLPKDSVAQSEEHDDLEGLLKMGDKSITEGHFMSRAINTKRSKKPSFLDEPLYCISRNNEPSTEADILSIPLQTKGGEALNNPLE